MPLPVISQGSVATRLRCGGQCDSQFVANFLMNLTMEKFRKSVNICQSYGQKYRGPFLTHSVYSQGSVATLLMCGGIFNDYFVANRPQRLPVKEF